MIDWATFLVYICIITVISTEKQCKYSDTVVDCSRFNLTSLNGVHFPPRTTKIRLQGNQLNNLDPTAFNGLDQLEYLNLANNKLEAIHTNQFAHLHNLQFLKLAKNRIKTIEFGAFEGLGRLQNLDLSRNTLTTIPTLLFGGGHLSTLKSLTLARNHLKTISPGAFYGIDELRFLNLSSNKLDSNLIADGGFYGLGSLEELDLSKNRIDILSSRIHNYVPNLKKLWLSSNNLTRLTENRLVLPRLEYLSLSFNQLEYIHPSFFNGLSSLVEIDLSRNKLANIIEDKMNRVSLPHIRRLNFASNNLKVIPTDAFTLFPSLESLDLQHNPISSILEGSFTGIKTLYINTESLYCDCTLKPFVEWLNVNDMVDVQVKCQNPFKLRGQSLLEVPVEDLICGTGSPLVRPIKHPQSLAKLLLGTTALFTCSGHGRGPLELEWRVLKDGIAVKLSTEASKQVVFVNQTEEDENEYVYGELEIRNLTMEDTGVYQCSIQNTHNTVYLDPVQLIVQERPTFRLTPKDVVAMQGSNVLLECAAAGSPIPLIKWDKDRKNGFPAAIERRLHLRESDDGIYLLNVSKKDEGLYSCHAISDAGHIEHSANVRIFDRVFRSRMSTQTIQKASSEAIFDCSSELDSSSFELKWFWNERIPINETKLKTSIHNQTLTIHWIEGLKDGVITCELYLDGQFLVQQSAELVATSEVENKSIRSPGEMRRKIALTTTTKKRKTYSTLLIVAVGLLAGILLGAVSMSFCLVARVPWRKNDELVPHESASKKPLTASNPPP